MRKFRSQLILGAVLAFAIYAVMIFAADSSGYFGEGVLSALADFSWWLLPLMLLVQIIGIGFRFWEWQYFMGVLGVRESLSLRDHFAIYMTGTAMTASPLRAGELVKSVLLKVKTGLSVASSVPVVLAERLVDTIAVLLILLASLAVAGRTLVPPAYYDLSLGLVIVMTALYGIVLLMIHNVPLTTFYLWIAARLPIIRRFHDFFATYFESCRQVFLPRYLAVPVLMGVGVYAFNALGFWLVLAGFGLTPTLTLLLQSAFIVGMASAISGLSVLPNGIGVNEISITALLMLMIAPEDPLMVPGVAAGAALLQSGLYRWMRVLLGVGVMLIERERLFTTAFETALQDIEKSDDQPEIEMQPA